MYKILLIACFCFLFAGCATTRGVGGQKNIEAKANGEVRIGIYLPSSDAEMFLDNRFVGGVPQGMSLKALELIPGCHIIKIIPPEDLEIQKNVCVEPDQIAWLGFEFPPHSSSLTTARIDLGKIVIFSGTHGAKIYLDNRFIGTVPYEKPIKLVPGVHTIRMEKHCFAEYTDTFSIAPGESKEMEIDLFAFAGLIKVTSNVKGAVVKLDNKVLGTAPMEFEAGFGAHQVSVVKRGYKEATHKVLVTAAETYEVNIRLVPE